MAGQRSCRERGATLVEFALVLPVFMMLVLGMFTGGHAYFRKISVTDAVREGARYGASLVVEGGDLVAWADAVEAKVESSSGGELDGSVPGQICAALVTVPDATDACGVDDPPGSDGQQVVKVSATRDAELEFLVATRTITLRSEAAALYERSSG